MPRRAARRSPVICLVALAGTCALGLWLTARSLPRWHFYQDALVMHYIAGRILDGAVPYRDILDMNLPGTYLVRPLGLLFFGPSDAGGRAFDLAVLAGTCAGVAAALRTYGPWASAFGAAGVWVYHLGLGSINAGQRRLRHVPASGLDDRDGPVAPERRPPCPPWRPPVSSWALPSP